MPFFQLVVAMSMLESQLILEVQRDNRVTNEIKRNRRLHVLINFVRILVLGLLQCPHIAEEIVFIIIVIIFDGTNDLKLDFLMWKQGNWLSTGYTRARARYHFMMHLFVRSSAFSTENRFKFLLKSIFIWKTHIRHTLSVIIFNGCAPLRLVRP